MVCAACGADARVPLGPAGEVGAGGGQRPAFQGTESGADLPVLPQIFRFGSSGPPVERIVGVDTGDGCEFLDFVEQDASARGRVEGPAGVAAEMVHEGGMEQPDQFTAGARLGAYDEPAQSDQDVADVLGPVGSVEPAAGRGEQIDRDHRPGAGGGERGQHGQEGAGPCGRVVGAGLVEDPVEQAGQ